MRIDLPITIIFDCQDFRSVSGFQTKNFIPRVCTLRFDSQDENAPVELFASYPPEERADYPSSENGDGVLAILTTPEFVKLTRRAMRNPYDYSVGTEEERTAAQAEADEQAAQNGY